MNRLALVLLYPLLLLALAFTALRYAWAVATSPAKATAIAYMIDETANVGLNGKVDTTISGRVARARARGRRWGCVLCWMLDRLEPGHCARMIDD